MTKREKNLAIATALVVGIGICLKLFGMQAFYFYKAKTTFPQGRTPEMYVIPEKLTSTNSLPPAMTFTNYGFCFSVPWNNLNWVREEEPFSVYRFSNNRSLIIEADDISSLLLGELKTEWHGKDRSRYASVFGAENIRSNYALLSACLNASPDSLSLFENKRTSFKKFFFLIPKSLAVNSNTGKIYTFDFNNCKGFQIGDTASNSRISLMCFADPNTSTSFILSSGQGDPLSQEEVNCIIK